MRQFRTGMMLSALLMVAGSGVALAEQPAPADAERGGHKMMAKIDTDGDGAVSKAEFLAGMEKNFARMDKNGDGKLTPDERPQHHKKGGMRDRKGGPDGAPMPPESGDDAPPPPPAQ